jgi:hypothetical protein
VCRAEASSSLIVAKRAGAILGATTRERPESRKKPAAAKGIAHSIARYLPGVNKKKGAEKKTRKKNYFSYCEAGFQRDGIAHSIERHLPVYF